MPTPVAPPSPIPNATSTPQAAQTTPQELIQEVTGNIGASMDIVYVIVGIILLVFVVLAVAFIFIRFRRGFHRTRIVSVNNLVNSINDPRVDAVGLLLDLDNSSARIVPLRRVESFYVSDDINYPAIVIANPYSKVFNIHGKPLIIAVSTGKSGYQVDVHGLTTLGFAQIALENPLWRNITEPQKSYEMLVEKLAALTGNRKGEIRLAPGLKLAFQMSPPDVIIAMIRQNLDMLNAVFSNLVNFSSAIESISRAIRSHKLQELREKGKLIWYIIMGLGILALLVGIALYLYRLAGGG